MQDTFKKYFVTMNQDARKTAETKVEKDFYKLLNNRNFVYDWSKNTNNCNLELLYDGVEEVKFIKKYTDIFADYKLKEFFTGDALREQIEQEIDEKINEYNIDNEFYCANETEMLKLKREEFEAIDGFLKSRKRKESDCHNYSKNVDMIENKIETSEDLPKNKMLIELNTPQGSAVKKIAVKLQTNVKCTTRFLAGKMLMFAKLSLNFFIYQLAELFMFPGEIVQAIYDKYQIERVYVCLQIPIARLYNLLPFLVYKALLPNRRCVTSFSKYFLEPQSLTNSTSLTIFENSLTFTMPLTKTFWVYMR